MRAIHYRETKRLSLRTNLYALTSRAGSADVRYPGLLFAGAHMHEIHWTNQLREIDRSAKKQKRCPDLPPPISLRGPSPTLLSRSIRQTSTESLMLPASSTWRELRSVCDGEYNHLAAKNESNVNSGYRSRLTALLLAD